MIYTPDPDSESTTISIATPGLSTSATYSESTDLGAFPSADGLAKPNPRKTFFVGALLQIMIEPWLCPRHCVAHLPDKPPQVQLKFQQLTWKPVKVEVRSGTSPSLDSS
jgi:hypothetical protein